MEIGRKLACPSTSKVEKVYIALGKNHLESYKKLTDEYANLFKVFYEIRPLRYPTDYK